MLDSLLHILSHPSTEWENMYQIGRYFICLPIRGAVTTFYRNNIKYITLPGYLKHECTLNYKLRKCLYLLNISQAD